jgi:hypothetical protein
MALPIQRYIAANVLGIDPASGLPVYSAAPCDAPLLGRHVSARQGVDPTSELSVQAFAECNTLQQGRRYVTTGAGLGQDPASGRLVYPVACCPLHPCRTCTRCATNFSRVWLLDAAGFTNGAAPCARFNGRWRLPISPTANCQWSYTSISPPFTITLVVGAAGASTLTLAMPGQPNVVYTHAGTFNCSGFNILSRTSAGACGASPTTITLTPGSSLECPGSPPPASCCIDPFQPARVSFSNRSGCECLHGFNFLVRRDISSGRWYWIEPQFPPTVCGQPWTFFAFDLNCLTWEPLFGWECPPQVPVQTWGFAWQYSVGAQVTVTSAWAGNFTGKCGALVGSAGCYPLLDATLDCGPPLFLQFRGVRLCRTTPPLLCDGEIDVTITQTF